MDLQYIFTESLKEELYILKEYHKLTNYEYTELISLILTNGIITHNTVVSNDINYFINLIIDNRKHNIINDNSYVYNNSIKYIITNYYSQVGVSEKTFYEIINNWFNGYLFHSLNNCFVSKINTDGFILDDKPWNIEDIKKIKEIFKRNIFGLSNGEDNVIFFSTSLMSSPYYGLTSPTFYRKFIENEPQYLNVYLNRNIEKAYESVNNLCNKYQLDNIDKEIVIDFFKKYWLMFTKEELPSVILMKRTENKSFPYPEKDIINKTIELIKKDTRNKIIRHNIDRNDLIIFNYDSLDIIKYPQKSLDT